MSQRPGIRQGLTYGLLGLPLAFVALPLYVVLPNHYARAFGVPLAALGLVLLAARLFDALIDPLIGRWCDRLFSRSARSVLLFAGACVVLLASGFALLFFPAVQAPGALLVWALAMLVVTYAGYSGLSVAHQAWGAMLGGDAPYRSRVVAWREGMGLAGVVLASLAPLFEMNSATSPGLKMPASPCSASDGWRNRAGVPVLVKVAAPPPAAAAMPAKGAGPSCPDGWKLSAVSVSKKSGAYTCAAKAGTALPTAKLDCPAPLGYFENKAKGQLGCRP